MPPPQIDSLSLSVAGYGDTVLIHGSRFTGAQQIYFGSAPAESFTVISDNLLKARVANGATGSVSVYVPAIGYGYFQGFTHTGPVINYMTPTAGVAGTTVTLYGKNFLNTNTVTVGGIPATSFSILSADTISFVTPVGGVDTIKVTAPKGTAIIKSFNKASITQVNVSSATVGDTLSIRGLNLGTSTAVLLGSTPARWYGVFGDTLIKAVVDTLPGTGSSWNYITVITPLYGTAVSPNPFIYSIPMPAISTFSPIIGGPGTVVTIKGIRFSNATKVSFGGTPAASFTIVSGSEIKAVVGNGSSGYVSVENVLGGNGYNNFTFTVLPYVQSFFPASGPPGTQVIIKGFNFSRNNKNNVFFGSVKATILSSTDTLIKAIVPYGAEAEPFTVTNDSLVAYAPKSFSVTFSGDSLLTPSSFSSVGSLQLKQHVKAIGDFDNDGKPDLVSVGAGNRFDSNKIYVFRNTSTPGAISFDNTLAPYSISGDVRHATTADVDANGKLDIVMANYGGSIIVLKNTSTPGNISFAAPYYSPSSYVSGSIFSGIVVSDFNQDGKPDIALCSEDEQAVFIFKNTTVNGQLAFSNVHNYSNLIFYLPIKVAVNIIAADIDGDKKNDLVVSSASYNTTNGSSPGLAVLTNTGTNGNFGFNITNLWYNKASTDDIAIGDMDGDDKPDLVATGTTGIPVISTFKNITPGLASFALVDTFNARRYPHSVTLADINGDKKKDMLVLNSIDTVGGFVYYLSLLKNKTRPTDAPRFDSLVSIRLQRQSFMGKMLVNDLDLDGRPDLVINPGFSTDSMPTILRNKIGPDLLQLCPPSASGNITSTVSGSTWQWQADTSGNFYNIGNSSLYNGTTTATLQLINLPTSMYGAKFRCLVDGVKPTDQVEVRFRNLWTGNVNTAWENPANWSCGTVPDSDTDVIVNGGNITINSNVIVGSLTISEQAILTIRSPFSITLTH